MNSAHKLCPPCFVLVLLSFISLNAHTFASDQKDTKITVAAADSSGQAKAASQFLCDGEGDQEEIRQAILALPDVGGIVHLAAGTYDIRHVPETLGGILIDRSNIILEGEGAATKLIQAPNQNTNVIRIIGSDVGYITLRDLYVDANREENQDGEGDPNVSHGRFEFCGIKAFYTFPGGPTGIRNHHITIQNCHVYNARRLGIMLEGSYMKVLNNHLGNANSDVVEILTGPGEIRGNHFVITGETHVAVGSDRADNIIMSDNIVNVKEGADLDIGFRSWSNSYRHVISNNVLTIDKGGHCDFAMDIRGNGASVTGNTVHSSNTESQIPLRILGGNTVVTGNLLENVELLVDDQTDLNLPILISNNILSDSKVTHKKGNLTTGLNVESQSASKPQE